MMNAFAQQASPFASQPADRKIERLVSEFEERFDILLTQLNKEEELFRPAIQDRERLRWLVEGFCMKRTRFRQEGRPETIQVGYHYTNWSCMPNIQKDGLKAMGKRENYGSGIYTANNPHAFRSFGDTGIIVLILPGVMRWCFLSEEPSEFRCVDSIIGNRGFKRKSAAATIRSPYFDEVVLRGHDQVLPLIHYNRELTNNADLMWKVHQTVAAFVGAAFRTEIDAQRVLPSTIDIRQEHLFGKSLELFDVSPDLWQLFQRCGNGSGGAIWDISTYQRRLECYLFPRVFIPLTETCPGVQEFDSEQGNSEKELSYVPRFLSFYDTEECPVCFEAMCSSTAVIAMATCGHMFHKCCIDEALKRSMKCPICRAPAGKPRGLCPSGTMTVHQDLSSLEGFPGITTLVITYTVPSGIQSFGHPNPNYSFEGTKRVAYIPNTTEGRKLVLRLKYAFHRGLIFHVSTSLSTGQSNVVCWASIHHKTSRRGGMHGWPDPNYFANCNSDLDAQGVPPAEEAF